jgi:hypothetical protein
MCDYFDVRLRLPLMCDYRAAFGPFYSPFFQFSYEVPIDCFSLFTTAFSSFSVPPTFVPLFPFVRIRGGCYPEEGIM